MNESLENIKIKWLIDNDDIDVFYGQNDEFKIDVDDDTDENELIARVEHAIKAKYGIPYYFNREEWKFV